MSRTTSVWRRSAGPSTRPGSAKTLLLLESLESRDVPSLMGVASLQATSLSVLDNHVNVPSAGPVSVAPVDVNLPATVSSTTSALPIIGPAITQNIPVLDQVLSTLPVTPPVPNALNQVDSQVSRTLNSTLGNSGVTPPTPITPIPTPAPIAGVINALNPTLMATLPGTGVPTVPVVGPTIGGFTGSLTGSNLGSSNGSQASGANAGNTNQQNLLSQIAAEQINGTLSVLVSLSNGGSEAPSELVVAGDEGPAPIRLEIATGGGGMGGAGRDQNDQTDQWTGDVMFEQEAAAVSQASLAPLGPVGLPANHSLWGLLVTAVVSTGVVLGMYRDVLLRQTQALLQRWGLMRMPLQTPAK